jgi:fatty-acid desaturase
MFERIISVLGLFTMTGDPINYAKTHRWHHIHMDTLLDFHSPIHGIFHSFIGWMLKDVSIPNTIVKDLYAPQYGYLVFLGKHKVKIIWFTLLVTGFFSLKVVLGLMLAMCFSCFMELLTNTIAHSAEKKCAKNVKLLAWFTLSTYHFDHHRHPKTVEPCDPGYLLFQVLKHLRLLRYRRHDEIEMDDGLF